MLHAPLRVLPCSPNPVNDAIVQRGERLLHCGVRGTKMRDRNAFQYSRTIELCQGQKPRKTAINHDLGKQGQLGIFYVSGDVERDFGLVKDTC
jgi:hypothetical protein